MLYRLSRTTIVAVGLLMVACTAIKPVERSASGTKSVKLTLAAPAAKSVAVAGSFNEWSTVAQPMTAKDSDGAWSIRLDLPRGEYRFMYVIDGREWLTPPVADDFVDDGFGQKNGILVVR
jgi:1,4-alpha-glucan branching enzyme